MSKTTFLIIEGRGTISDRLFLTLFLTISSICLSHNWLISSSIIQLFPLLVDIIIYIRTRFFSIIELDFLNLSLGWNSTKSTISFCLINEFSYIRWEGLNDIFASPTYLHNIFCLSLRKYFPNKNCG